MDKWILSFTQSLIQFFKAEMAGMHVWLGVCAGVSFLMRELAISSRDLQIPLENYSPDKRKEIFNQLP